MRFVNAVFQISVSVTLFVAACIANADEHTLHSFERTQLTGTYYSEGVNFGDLNNDGHNDVVYGPYWFAGPDFTQKYEIYKPVSQNVDGYADHFFCWVYDFDGNGLNDILTVGFPGTPAYVYENPGRAGQAAHWPKHEVFDWVSNEAPQFKNLVGDERPELICTRDGYFGYVTPNWSTPFAPWTFHRVSRQVASKRFGHGLGIGDVNGDTREDLLASNGWYEQPESLSNSPQWKFHPHEFAPAAADMFAYDVDGDGDNDVITSLNAHEYGLVWYEQVRDGNAISFEPHTIMGTKVTDNQYGVLFTELHSVNLVDVDGDGLKDICTGKTYYSHHKQSPMWDAGAVVYWFQLQRTSRGVEWIPHKADSEAGIGRQLIVADINGDALPDFLSGGMKGCHVLKHQTNVVDRAVWNAAQPQRVRSMASGLSPKEAAEHMTVPAGFQVQLAAGEPLVHQPIAFTFDHRGRVWVAEAYTYPQRAPEGQGRDKIVILEDTDLDGALDKRTVFAEGLNLVSGIEVGFGGVWVGAAPYLMFIPDKNGDDVPDSEPQILLDGFGYQDTHEVLNAFIWGPDGWLYGCHGVFTHSKVGTPGTPESQRIPMNAAVWRYHPTRHTFDVFMNGTSNPWGVDFNDHGHAFITACVIPHMFHVIQGARYQRQGGQHFNSHTYEDIKTIADHAHYAGNIRDGAWWGHEPKLSSTNDLAGGGHAHCGAMIYLGNNWPQPYRDSIYFHNVHGNRVNNDLLKRSASGYVASHGKDFLKANDHYFRGINLKSGPEGAVHLIDWYDKNACHRTNPEIWDRSNGRIYRVSFGTNPPQTINLSSLSNLDLAKLQSHDNEWHVRTARRILQERVADGLPIDETTKRELLVRFRSASNTPKRLRALWALQVIGEVDADLIAEALDDVDENVRGWAIQLALDPAPSTIPFPDRSPAKSAQANADSAEWQPSPQLESALIQLAKTEQSPLVRLYCASALQRIPLDSRWPIAEHLVQHASDASDQNIPLMIWYGVEPLVPLDPKRALQLATISNIPAVSRFITRRAAAESASLDHVMTALNATSSETRHMILDEILRAFEGRVDIPMPSSWSGTYTKLLRDDDPTVRDMADRVALLLGDKRLLPRLRQLVANPDASPEKRLVALNALVRSRDTRAAEALTAALAEPKLRRPAIRALAAFDRADTTRELLNRYHSFTKDERQDAINTLTARPASAMALLDAIEGGKIPRGDVHAYNVRQLRSFPDTVLLERLESVWGTIREASADKKQQIAKWKSQLTKADLQRADLSHGRAVFAKTCASCHKLFGTGADVGPDITGSNRANLDYILENVVDPSAVVSKDYLMSTIYTNDGRAITGLVFKESDSAITVRTVNDTVVIAHSEIEERKQSVLSLMPEGQLDQLAPDEARDLIAYLASPSQVPLPRVESTFDPKTGKVLGAIEGETMKVIGKTGGNVRNQPMGGFKADRWSGSDHLWWTGQPKGARLDLEFSVPENDTYRMEMSLTRARDYGTVQLAIDGQSIGAPIDAFHPNSVLTTGRISFDKIELSAGRHKLSATIVGKHPKSVGYMFGLDYVRFVPLARAHGSDREPSQ